MGQGFGHFFILTVLLAGGSSAFAQESKSTEDGRKIFIEKRCYTCHTIKAEAELIEKEKEIFAKAKGVELKSEEEEEADEEKEGDEDEKKGGDLSHVGKEREVKWIREFIQKPRDYFKKTADCKRKAKKKHRKRFKGTDEELEVLVAYISGLKYPQQEKRPESCVKEKDSQ